MKTIVKTPGQRYFEETYPNARWDSLNDSDHETYEVKASRLGIQPLEQDVPKTDGELLYTAYRKNGSWDNIAAEFLLLLRERDGEPLEVTPERLDSFFRFADGGNESLRFKDVCRQINAYRGVRAEKPLPKVTTEMVAKSREIYSDKTAADYINAKLAEASR